MTLLGVYFYLEENMCIDGDNFCLSGISDILLFQHMFHILLQSRLNVEKNLKQKISLNCPDCQKAQ